MLSCLVLNREAVAVVEHLPSGFVVNVMHETSKALFLHAII